MNHIASRALSPLALLMTLLTALSGCGSPQVNAENPADAATSTSEQWEATIEHAAKAIVALHLTVPRGFDTEEPGSYVGTGFIVDAERGIILTNRHIVQPGPVSAEAVFYNHEEIPLTPIYRDPVHDFGFFSFDPSLIRYMDVVALPLAPEGARVGVDIRVIGNDAGEKLSILAGTLARLDRDAPSYGGDTYNDFNTFYMQAASGTSGGSSGSPVLDLRGRVIGLNAGGRTFAASSFFLPLDRVVRALNLLRGEQGRVPRGTIQTVFRHEPYEQLGRLGLSEEIEAEFRTAFPDRVGMLVVDEVVPEGPADGKLQPGDILTALDGERLTGFVALEEVLDASVGRDVTLSVQRGGETVETTIAVGDLHTITPSDFIESGSGVFHPLSYQQARNHNLPVAGIYVALSGYMLSTAGIPSGSLIHSVGDREIETLDDLWASFADAADGERLPVRFTLIDDPRHEHVSSMRMDHRWFPIRRCTRDDATGRWPCRELEDVPSRPAVEARTTSLPTSGPGPAPRVLPSLVTVDFDIPLRIASVWGAHFRGTGVIVDAASGLVVTDRDTVPVGLGDLEITFGGTLRVPGEVVFVHPLHNIAFVRYDPEHIGDTPVRSASFYSEIPTVGDPIWQIALSRDFELVARQTSVARYGPLSIPMPSRPQFRDTNLDVIELDDSSDSVGGVLCDDYGQIVALWSSFHTDHGDGMFRGIPVELITPLAEQLARGESPSVHTIGAELSAVGLADASELGLPQEYVQAAVDHDPRRRQVLMVRRLFAGFPAEEVLSEGDLIVAVDGQTATRFAEVERHVGAEPLSMTVFREDELVELRVGTHALDGRVVEHAALWAGVLLHDPHLEIASNFSLPRRGVYVAWYWFGSPASRFRLLPTRRIVEVDGTPTPDLESFLEVVRSVESDSYLRIKVIDLDEQEHMLTLQPDENFWPLREFRLTDEGWTEAAAPSR